MHGYKWLALEYPDHFLVKRITNAGAFRYFNRVLRARLDGVNPGPPRKSYPCSRLLLNAVIRWDGHCRVHPGKQLFQVLL